ncbi:hypothetical protein SAMN05446037_10499 [Anaerovirgula multivorans]|uniref:Haemolysin XhlA n=1 Tax=Anaerovirgula multivorans TaxID=312168 RepID=A0A239KMX1_9FIRM|nr:hypothetical protein [Anaerovirgula multivorans]SNT18514.1 hypothetical protein SAMN05446037_10499 [Anaerovirgula multivorans]
MICDRHQEISDRLNKHDERLRDLERINEGYNQKFIILFKKLDELTAWIKALVMLGGATLLGFFFWYVQNIGR